MNRKVIFLLFILLAMAFTYSESLQNKHQQILNQDNASWLLKSEHVYLSKNSVESNTLDNNISIYYSQNCFSIYHQKFDFVVHTKAILTIQKDQIQIDIIHKANEQKIEYVVRLALEKKTSLEVKSEKNEQQILLVHLKHFSNLYKLAKQYQSEQSTINCLKIAGEYTDMDFSLTIPFIFSSEKDGKGGFGGDKKYHNWYFVPNKLSSVKTFPGITIIFIEAVVQESAWMNGDVVTQGIGTDTSIASLANATWAGNGSSSYVKGVSRLYYKTR